MTGVGVEAASFGAPARDLLIYPRDQFIRGGSSVELVIFEKSGVLVSIS